MILRLLFVAAGCCAGVAAQQVIWSQTGIQDKLWIWGDPVVLGDINRDGLEDLAEMGRYLGDPRTGPLIYVTLVRSGKDGALLRADPGPELCWSIYGLYPAGDMDRDGITDYAWSWYDGICNQGGVVSVQSGRTGARLWWVQGAQWSDQFGSHVAGGGDVNGDGLPDLLVYAEMEPTQTGRGVLRAYDHRGVLLWTLPASAFRMGVGFMGDLDRDGHDDFIVAGWDVATSKNLVRVHSGRTLAVLVTGSGDDLYDRLGTGMVGGCGDIDGDGVLDFVAKCDAGFAVNPLLRVFSGRTGQPIHSWREIGAGRYVTLPEYAVADFDLDGVNDFATTTVETFFPARLAVVSGRDGRLLTEILMPGPGTQAWSWHLASISERVGDPFPALVVSEAAYGTSNTSLRYVGRLWTYRPVTSAIQTRGSRCAGAAGPPPSIGWRDLGGNLARLHVSGASAGGTALLLLGLSNSSWGGHSLPIPLDAIGLSGCLLHNSVDAWGLLPIGTTGLDRGFAAIDLPTGQALPQRLHAQWLTFDARATALGATPSLSWR